MLISHAHNDHTSDFESIITLLHKYNEDLKGLDDETREDTIRGELAKVKGVAHKDISNKEIEDEFSKKRKVIHFYITQSVNKKFSGMLDLSGKMNFDIHVIEENDKKSLSGIKIKAIKAKHFDLVSDRHSVGFVIEINDHVLVYTGDSGWNNDIESEYKQIKETYEAKTIILLAHLGGIKENEKLYVNDFDQQYLYKNHLGRLGLVRLIQTLKPKCCLISEFGEEMKNARIEFAEIYRKVFKDTIFLPADIGLKYSFEKSQIEAITKINIKKTNNPGFKHYDEGYVNPDNVGVIMLHDDSSLHYYDKNGKFSESDLVQVLIREYADRVR